MVFQALLMVFLPSFDKESKMITSIEEQPEQIELF